MSPDLARLLAILSGISFFILCVVLLEDFNRAERLKEAQAVEEKTDFSCECTCR